MKPENCGLCLPCAYGNYDECETFPKPKCELFDKANARIAQLEEALSKVKDDVCPKCGNSLDNHNFGVPELYCP